MLFDPRWIKKSKPSFSEPSLEGFFLFVTLQMLRDPDSRYHWPCTGRCAVARYLWSIDQWASDWNENEQYMFWDALAYGDHVRDKRGRFTADPTQGVWRWSDLYKRLQSVLKV